MSRNLVLCCDGTANQFSADQTNVIKLFSALDLTGPEQLGWYHPGLGTMEPPGALTPLSQRMTRLLGMALGYGLQADIRDAYVYLMNTYQAGDQVYLFGFSRGAYTARAVASLLYMYGLMPRGHEPLVPYAIRMLMAVNKISHDPAKRTAEEEQFFRLARDFKATFCRTPCEIRFVGVWDTVSSVGWVENPVHLPFTASNPDIQIGRHAISIDERRAFFRTNLWRSRDGVPQAGPIDVKQVWFPGVHCDVGGGYPEAESGLSKIALKWMLEEARAAGLHFDPIQVARVLGDSDPAFCRPNPQAEMHESLSQAWWIAELFPKRHYNWTKRCEERRMNLGRRRTIPPRSLIHRSAYDRGEDYKRLLPADAVVVG